jgi:NAD(P)-dependent dehydrogenase (short-subunit alcohol dehydrogenase family)
MELNLAGKVAIVTGAARGIGKATALCLGKEGAKVVIDDIDLAAAKQVEAEAVETGIEAMAVEADVTRFDEARKMVSATLERFGRIDILVNNAGIWYRDGQPVDHRLFKDTTEDDWRGEIDVTLFGVLHCTRAVVDTMLAQQSGSIVNISSDAARGPQIDRISLYGAGKGGIIAFSKNLAWELGPQGIRVNCIAPGTIKSTRLQAIEAGLETREDGLKFAKERMDSVQITPLRRIGTTQEVANLVAFLASDVSGFITGQTYSINGGRYMV